MQTNQYSATDFKRNPHGPRAYPGLFFKFDVEPLTMNIHRRSMTFLAFVVRLTGVLGGMWLCTNFAFRTAHRLLLVLQKSAVGRQVLKTFQVSTGEDTSYAMSPAQPQGSWGNPGVYDGSFSATSAPNYAQHPQSFTTHRMPNHE